MTTKHVARGVVGVAIRNSNIPGFDKYLRHLNPSQRPNDSFLREIWSNLFGCSPAAAPFTTYASSLLSRGKRQLQEASLPPCSGTESLEGVQHPFTYTSELRVTYNVYLAVYAVAYALHNLLCPSGGSPAGNNSCSFPKDIKPIEVIEQLHMSQ